MTKAAHLLRRPTFTAAALAFFWAAPAPAQLIGGDGDRIVTLGLGAQVYSRFPGSDDFAIGPYPGFSIRREGEPPGFEAGDEAAGFALADLGGIRFGPSVNLVRSRRDEDVGAPVGRVPWTAEVGLFVETYLSPNLRLRADGRRGVNGHDSWVGDIGADVIVRPSPDSWFSIGPRIRLAEDRFFDAYFGVTPQVAAATGLAVHDPGGGIYALGGTAGFHWQFDRTWGAYGFARYDRLVGGAADSPIVRRHGARDQFGAGLGLTYSFRLGGG